MYIKNGFLHGDLNELVSLKPYTGYTNLERHKVSGGVHYSEYYLGVQVNVRKYVNDHNPCNLLLQNTSVFLYKAKEVTSLYKHTEENKKQLLTEFCYSN